MRTPPRHHPLLKEKNSSSKQKRVCVHHATFSLNTKVLFFQVQFPRIPTSAAFSAKGYVTKPQGPSEMKEAAVS